MANILVIRLSAIGDVAMTLPVIYSAARSNPEYTFTVLTQTFLIPVFINRPSNVKMIGINTKGAEKGLSGLVKFAWAISRFDYDIVIDLHNVLRTMIIRGFCRSHGKKIFVIDKCRKEQKQLVWRKNKVMQPIRPVIDRYADVFKKAELNYINSFTSLFTEKPVDFSVIGNLIGEKKGKWIGIAPFAKHKGKIYPLAEMEKVVKYLSDKSETTIFLFGGKGEEEAILEDWASSYPNLINMAGRYSLDIELDIISQLDLLLSMDSANMHFASLVNTRVLSIWGATHPYAGFYGFHQNPDDTIQLELSCRPCSIYGNKPCYRKDWACMNELNSSLIIERLNQILC